MFWLAGALALSGLASCAMPFITNFPLLLTVRLLQFLATGLYVTADCTTVILVLGPVSSRQYMELLL